MEKIHKYIHTGETTNDATCFVLVEKPDDFFGGFLEGVVLVTKQREMAEAAHTIAARHLYEDDPETWESVEECKKLFEIREIPFLS